MTTRTRPNILITGTPGTGKTCLCTTIAERLNLQHVQVGSIVESAECHEGRDEAFDAFILDEEKLCDEMEDAMATGGAVVDFHSCDFFPERWFDLVLVLRCDNTLLFDRLTRRGYAQPKIEENVTAEIMQVVLEEAREAYAEDIVHELRSDTLEEMEGNITRVQQWVEQWMKDNR